MEFIKSELFWLTPVQSKNKLCAREMHQDFYSNSWWFAFCSIRRQQFLASAVYKVRRTLNPFNLYQSRDAPPV